MAFTFTKASVTFLHADETIREKVGRDIFINFAASLCFISSKHASRIASNSSILSTTPSSSLTGLHFGRKHLSPGKHLTHLVFFGRIHDPFCYEHWFIINFTTKQAQVNMILSSGFLILPILLTFATAKNQIIIPSKIAKNLGLKKGALFTIEVHKNKIELVPLEIREKVFGPEVYSKLGLSLLKKKVWRKK